MLKKYFFLFEGDLKLPKISHTKNMNITNKVLNTWDLKNKTKSANERYRERESEKMQRHNFYLFNTLSIQEIRLIIVGTFI